MQRKRADIMNLGKLIAILSAFFFVAGCNSRSSPDSLVRTFGSLMSPDGGKRLVVTKREKSLVDFEVMDSATGKRLANDTIGSDAMRWFLYWETSSRLWGYGSDTGYFKLFEFKPDGTMTAAAVDATMAVPAGVWENLPSSLQVKYKVQSHS